MHRWTHRSYGASPGVSIFIHGCHECSHSTINHRSIERLSKYLGTFWPIARVLSLDLSLIFTRFGCEGTVYHCLVILELIDILCTFHIFVLDIFVIWLELSLNLLHFMLDFQLLFDLKLSLQMLTHVPWILRL
jgi:hypothetical protein